MKNSIGKLIGSGATADVYEWSNAEVIKVFKPNISSEVIQYEEYIGKILNNTTLSIPKYIKTIRLKSTFAIIYERVYGKSLAEVLMESNDTSKIALDFANLHYKINQCFVKEIPKQSNTLNWRISRARRILGDNIKKVEELLSSLPIRNKLCHGDFHPFNILVNSDKYFVLDWNDCFIGNPIIDVGLSYLALNSPSIKEKSGEIVANESKKFSEEYLEYYCKYASLSKDEILKYLPLAASLKLDDNLSSDNKWLKDMIR
ncbi:phosphotransferase [Clostridium sp. SHJSY1]|uniref:phosphotransferase n=1 Tax=Clostridium sp. SHJSY1 TaxID=2942483 RepID=UPI00287530DB|nr:phosphotransferase [Clostridium sp. SHJSY1]MDS0524624.1 phosphotransferase [Clostridium sp. SHJSY1]